MDEEVVIFCQKQIVESGLVLDEDLIFVNVVETLDRKPGRYIYQGVKLLASVATVASTALFAFKKGKISKTISIGVISLPIAYSLLTTVLHRRKLENHKKQIVELLKEFRNLSKIHLEVNDFFKSFKCLMDSASSQFVNSSDKKLHDLSECSCDTQTQITKQMLKFINEIHTGLQDVTLDLSNFEEAIAVTLTHDSLKRCTQNSNFVEGQVVLLRSHLLTSIYLVSSRKGDQAVFSKVLNEIIPSLVSLLKRGVNEIRQTLNNTRFPNDPPLLSLNTIERIVAQKQFSSVPRMRRHVVKINDGICCTFLKLKALQETVDNVEAESQMISLQRAVATLTQELHKCYMSSADLEKLLELLNRNTKNREIDLKSISEVPKEDTDSTIHISEQVTSEVDLLETDSDYQIYTNELCDIEDDNERNAVRFYKRFMNTDADWLAELRQCDAFQKRQTKFHTVLPFTSTPVDLTTQSQDEEDAFETALSHQASTSGFQFQTPPPPPPLPSSFSAELSGLKAPFSPVTPAPSVESSSPSLIPIPEAPPLPPLTVVESSLLLDSLRGAIDKMGSREEEEYEWSLSCSLCYC